MFGMKTSESRLKGHDVYINEAGRSPVERAMRARMRIDGLSRKLQKLTIRGGSKEAIEQVTFAIDQWKKRLDIARHELEVMEGK